MKDKQAQLRETIVEIGRLMYDRGHVISNDGNISARVDENSVLVTPSGISKGRLTPDMLVLINNEGDVLSGKRHASSETPMHLEVYRQKPEIKAVVHAHSPLATAFAIAGRAIDEPYMPELILGLGVVPVAPFAMPSTDEVPASIIGLLEGNALLLSNHGVLTWGKSLLTAFDYLEQVEYAAKIILTVEQLGGGRQLNEQIRERLFSLSDNYARLAGEREDGR